MTQAINTILQPRLKIIEIARQLTLEQLNTVPSGFNNNIIWNMGHVIAAQQGICYKRAGLTTIIDEEFFETFKPGTKPERFFDATDLEKIIGLYTSTLDNFESDLKTDMFANYPTWTTRYGVELSSIADAVAFLPFHEGLHIGAIIALRKLVG